MSESVAAQTPLTIRAETLVADPDSCKFTVSRLVHAGGPFLFESAERANGSPLAARLFTLPGVRSVLVAENIVTVGKDPDVSWSGLKAVIGAGIRHQLLSGIPAVLEGTSDATRGHRNDAEVRAAVQHLLDREVNRSVAEHGGKISIVDLRDGVLSIAMSGGCQGCAASTLTLRSGFEVMVRRVAPEIREIVDTTDHAAGATPFYRQAEGVIVIDG